MKRLWKRVVCFTMAAAVVPGQMNVFAATGKEKVVYHKNSVYEIGVDLNQEAFTGTTVINPYFAVSDYFNNYWDNINLNRMPGTTVIDSKDIVVTGDGKTPSDTSTTSGWVGGSTKLEGGAVKGIELSGGDITGKKSYMMFEDKIVCLGAGLTKRDGLNGSMITVLDNTALKDRTTKLTMSYANKTINSWLAGDSTKVPPVLPWELDTIYSYKDGGPAVSNDHSWIFIQDKTAPGLGYYMPKADIKNAQCRIRSTQAAGKERLYYELWLNHGELNDASYEYVMLPGKRASGDIKAYYDKPEAVVLVNNAQVQAVYDSKSQTMAANFWDAGGGSVKDSRISHISVAEKASVMMSEKEGRLSISVSDPEAKNNGVVHVEILRKWYSAIEVPQGVVVDTANKDKILLTVDVSKQDGQNFTAVFDTLPGVATGEEVTLVRGDQIRLELPAEFTAPVTWSSCFLKPNGDTVNMTGYSKYKRELAGDEKEGLRTAGPASASHIAAMEVLSDKKSCLISGKQKGTASIVATDMTGKKKIWTVRVLYESPDNLPKATPEDYAKIRSDWKENLVGSNLAATEEGRAALIAIDAGAKEKWDSYAYKGQDSCVSYPWTGDVGAAGNPDIRFEDDAVEFRSVVKNTLAMARAYAAEGSSYYRNPDMMEDMKHILNWFSETCYVPKSQTDNWWNWEIGMAKDLVPLLILISDDLSKEEIGLYCRGMRFYQPDPFYEGAVNFASTHAQGLRSNEGANLMDCSVGTLGVGALLEDNEDIYLAALATSGQYIINQVENSLSIPLKGYNSGFYEDGSYLDHSYMPYTGSYGIEFYRGGVSIASLLSQTPWEYSAETMDNMEQYVLEGFHTSIYKGHMLDNLKGRSVSRPNGDGRSAARDTAGLMIRMLKAGAFSPEGAEIVKSNLKNWLEADPEYITTLNDASVLSIRNAAEEIMEDSTIDSSLLPLHKNMAVMDRAVHRTDRYLFALSMYSSRIQNCEVTNGENLYGWHQGDGATYLYNDDLEQYVKDYWSTVNPYRLAGTTVVPVYIGNAEPDSSGYYQEGDYRSKEHWVGGSQLGNYGINGMSLSGDITAQKVSYAPELRAKKSYFMFENEIVCLGAGITNSGQNLPVETAIENRRLNDAASNQVVVDGREVELPLVQNNLEEIVKGTENTEGIMIEKPTWAYLEGNTVSSGIGYYFPDSGQNINLRKTENSGNWNLVGTSEGEAKQRYLEMWFDHGVNPDKESYEYAILPGKTPEELQVYSQNPGFSVLSNTDKIQAVYSKDTGVTGINFWTGGSEGVAEVTSDKAASVMMEETEDGILTIAVSDPTMRNTDAITLQVNKPVQAILNSDSNVEAEITDTGRLNIVVHTKGTNGSSSKVQVQLHSSVYPGAMTMTAGESMDFSIREFGFHTEAYTWKVTGNQFYRAPLTEISENGTLTVDADEKNGSLTVSALSDSGIIYTAFVNLRGDLTVTVPNEIKVFNDKFDKVYELVNKEDLADPQLFKAIVKAIDAMNKAENEALREYSMDKVVKLEELYINVLEANERSMGIQVETGDELNEVLPVSDIRGLALNVSYEKATSSNAVAVVRASKEPGLMSRSGTKRADVKASPSNASKTSKLSQKEKASPSNAVNLKDAYSAEELLSGFGSGKAVYMDVSFYLEDEDGNRGMLNDLKAPVFMAFGLPIDIGEDKTVTGYFIPQQGGKRRALPLSVNKSENTAEFVLTAPGYVMIEYKDKAEKP